MSRSLGVVCGLAAISLALPLFVSSYLPIQDLPQHVAAVRVLSEFSRPEFRFQEFFEQVPFQTPYWSAYALAILLSAFVGPLLAVKLVLALALVGTPFALRALLRALGKPEAYALLSIPLAYNAHVVLGFVNFVLALPLMLFGIALAVELRTKATGKIPVLLALVGCAAFLTHVVPYAVLVASASCFWLERDLRRFLRRLFVLAPSLVMAASWLCFQPSGQHLLGSSRSDSPRAESQGPLEALTRLPSWLTDVLQDRRGLWVLAGWSLVIVFIIGARALAGPRARTQREDESKTELAGELDRRLFAVFGLALAGYFLLPAGYGWIWPINARFSIVCALLGIALLPPVGPRAQRFAVMMALAVTSLHLGSVLVAFSAAEREYAGLPQLLERMPAGRRVAGLIFRPGSEAVAFAPYLHAVAWYQVERGGAVMFTFADFPQSPIRFRSDNRPPKVPPRWEWQPRRVRTETELEWYDYLLCRGAPPELPGFARLAVDNQWSVWRRAR